MEIDPRQLQKKFEYASAFEIEGSYNRQRAAAFAAALRAPISAPTTKVTVGTFRRTRLVIFYVDPESGLVIITDRRDAFISGWRLTERQLTHVLERGTL